MKKAPEVSIIVPCVDMLGMTKGCIDCIEKYTPPIYEIIIIADRCSEEMISWLKKLEKGRRARPIINPTLVGSTVALNMGIKAARGNYISLVMNDVKVTKGWFEPLLETLKSKPQYGWVSSRVYRGDVECPFGAADCCLISRGVIDKVGLLDEIFNDGIGYDINDYIRRMWAAGYSPHGVLRSTVYHLSREQTTMKMLHGDKILELGRRNYSLFVQKWNSPPDETNIPCIE